MPAKKVQQPQSGEEQKKAEEVLRQVELIVENSYDAIIGESLDGTITSWNRGATRMLGYTADEVIGKSSTFLLPPELKDQVPALLAKVKAGEFIADYDSVRLHKNGTRIDVALSLSPIKTEDGKVIGASIVERDITLRKKAEEVLRQSRLIVENSYDAIIGESLDGTITSWNRGATRMLGYTADEVIGKSSLFLLPPELKDQVPALLAKVRAGEFIADYDSVRLRKDGTRIDVALSLSPIKTEDGKVIGASIVEREITARKKAEEVLHQIELIVEDSHDAIIGKTLDGIITSWNGGAARMFGYSPAEVIGKPMANLFPPELKDELPRLLEKVRRGEVIADYDSIWLRKDGSRADVEFSISPVHAKGGTVSGASLVGRDITERKKSERHIKDLNETRNKFITIISHQLRTPLTAVNWNLETLLNGDFGKLEETQRKFLQVTHHSSIEITRRIRQLLTAMDVEEGRVRYETEEVSLDSLCAGVVNELQKKSEMKNIFYTYTPSAVEIPIIDGDGKKIREAISSVLDNAVIYTKDDGKVDAKLMLVGDVARFEVVDTGVGIPKLEQHHVFTRFFRASNAAIMQPDSFGLGLFIARSFIGQHGGEIGFESTEGKGSRFWIDLPLKGGKR